MVESRWVRRVGPGLAALGVVAIVATSTVGARDRPWDPPPCQAATPRGTPVAGAWWRMDPQLEAGRLVRQRLSVGAPGSTGPRMLDLDPESFAAGPFGGQVLVGTDDGRHSTLSLVDPVHGCARVVATTTAVIRRATLTPRHDAVIEFRVDRRTRADLGVFRRPLAGDRPTTRLLPPIEPDRRFGPTWSTEFTWSLDHRTLAIQSCGAVACRTRVVDPADGAIHLVAAPSHGDLIGLTRDRLVLHEACGGSPCAVVAVGITDGDEVVLDHAAWGAILAVGPHGKPEVVLEAGAGGRTLRAVGLDGSGVRTLRPSSRERRLVAGPGRSASAVELPPGLVPFGTADGRLPVDGPVAPLLRRLADDTEIAFDGVIR